MALESWAPRASQQSYDNTGLQVGDPETEVRRAIIALDLTPKVVNEAVKNEAQLIITHHPLIFRPLKTVTTSDWHGSLVHSMIANQIALYCIHTNLDAAYGGVSFALAERLGLKEATFLRPMSDTLMKLITFIPDAHLNPVREALAAAGAGRIGHYDACAFVTEGRGYFRPNEKANPTIGEAGGALETVNEWRIEVEVHTWQLGDVIRALKEAHPYEEVAYDVVPLKKDSTLLGMGAIGHLPEPEPLHEFLYRAGLGLPAEGLQYVGNLEQSIQKVAVCGGSGSDLIGDALRAGADAYLTADITYHRFFDVLDTSGNPRMALINAEHYATEVCTEDLLIDWLSTRFKRVDWIKTAHRTSPIQWWSSAVHTI